MEGPVADSILACANETHADLIVVGTHGRAGLGKMLMGSVSERVFHHSAIPVLTIGPHVQHPRVDPKSVLLATNCSPASQQAAHYACSLAREHDAVLTVAHVLDHVSDEAMRDCERLKAAVKEKLVELIRPMAGGFEVRYWVDFGPAVSGILRAAAESEADYLVLGVHQRSGLLDRFMWPTAYGVVREANCPVLTVRSAT